MNRRRSSKSIRRFFVVSQKMDFGEGALVRIRRVTESRASTRKGYAVSLTSQRAVEEERGQVARKAQ